MANAGTLSAEGGTERDHFDLVNEIWKTLECTEGLTIEIISVALDDIKTFDNKQQDYGPGNISKFGEHGCLVRASDKIERLINLFNKKTPDVTFPQESSLWESVAVNESIEDSWRDLTVYGWIARVVRAGLWR